MVATDCRARGWCFTINNPTEWDAIDIEHLAEQASYVISGKELGEQATPHFQGFAYFINKKSFDQVKSLIPRAHLERQRGPLDAAIEYCKKDGNFKEWGERPYGPAGQKNAHGEALKLARAGKFQEIEDKFPAIFLRYHAKLLSLYRPEQPLILNVLEHEWWYGSTGTGKSQTLWRIYPNHFSKRINKWWDRYNMEETVGIEEWEPKNECTAGQLKIWADRYPFTGEVKGGSIQRIRPLRIIVTSNYTIEECFPNPQDHLPLKRRFKVKHFVTV